MKLENRTLDTHQRWMEMDLLCTGKEQTVAYLDD